MQATRFVFEIFQTQGVERQGISYVEYYFKRRTGQR
jgi:hypothetical protein